MFFDCVFLSDTRVRKKEGDWERNEIHISIGLYYGSLLSTTNENLVGLILRRCSDRSSTVFSVRTALPYEQDVSCILALSGAEKEGFSRLTL